MNSCIDILNPCCGIKNPLIRKGASQDERLPKSLLPENFELDNRNKEDILFYLYKYAEQIKYFDLNNRHDGNWQPFFDFDQDSFLMRLSSQNLLGIEKRFLELEDALLVDRYELEGSEDENFDRTTNANPENDHYREMINYIYSGLAVQINVIYRTIPNEHPFKKEVENYVNQEIKESILNNRIENALVKLIGYDKGNPLNALGDNPINDYSQFICDESDQCSNLWGINQQCFDCISADNSYDLEAMADLFQVFFKVMSLIQKRAKYYFDEALKKNRSHLPHMSLLLTFLDLFQHAKQEINQLTDRHLKHYYENVLCLERKSEDPDNVHLVFELTKNFKQFKLEKGVELIGGKDASGKNRIYQTENELVINKAQVAEIKTLFINQDFFSKNEYLRLYAVPDATKIDGIEEDFNPPEAIRWASLGNVYHSPDIVSPNGQMGFAIASPILFLAEGQRTVDLVFTFDESVLPLYLSLDEIEALDEIEYHLRKDLRKKFYEGHFILQVSVDGEWMDLHEIQSNSTSADNAQDEVPGIFNVLVPESGAIDAETRIEDRQIHFQITLNKTFPALVPFPGGDDEIPFRTKWPMIKVLLRTEKEGASEFSQSGQNNAFYPYAILRNVSILECDIDVKVKDIRNLVIHNDNAPLDPSKEFFPFGALPKNKQQNNSGSNLFIGSKEVFSKRIDELVLNVEWGDLPIKPPEDISNGRDEFEYHYKEYDFVFNPPASDIPNGGNPIPGYEIPNNDSFKLKPFILVGRDFQEIKFDDSVDNGNYHLFVEDPQNQGVGEYNPSELLSKKKIVISKELNELGALNRYPRLIDMDVLDPFTADGGFLKLELVEGDFLHSVYSRVLSKISQWIANPNITVDINFPNDPFIPVIKSLSIDYKTSINVSLDNYVNFKNDTSELEQFFYLTPFGHKAIDVRNQINESEAEGIKFLPQFTPPKLLIPLEINPVNVVLKSCTETVNNQGVSNTVGRFENPAIEEGNYNSIGQLFFKREQNALTPEMLNYQGEILSFYYKNQHAPISFSPNIIKKVLLYNRSPLADGNLYIGFEDLEPQQSLSILFQVLEGSGNNKYAPPGIQWSYLRDNDWIEFMPGEIISDETKPDSSTNLSLLVSGIITFSIPKGISNKNTTILNPELLWIRASTTTSNVPSDLVESPAALPYLVDIRTQAVRGVFVNQSNSLEHLETALEKDTVTKLAVSKPEIKQVQQPYSSFGGRLQEKDAEFYKRVQERLRHKGRGVTPWDFERIVLEEFPKIYQVKCLNHSCTGSELNPGNITLAVIPDFRNNNNINPLEPRLHLGGLLKIETFLKSVTNLFVGNERHLRVVNPSFEEVRVACCVRFKKGRDVDYYQSILNQDIKRFLAPWAYETGNQKPEINFGLRLDRSKIINFIEEREYVDIISRFALLHYDEGGNLVPYYDTNGAQLAPEYVEEVIPTHSLAILTSYQRKHEGETMNIPYDHIVSTMSFGADIPSGSICKTCPS